jgi:hypothetical protein
VEFIVVFALVWAASLFVKARQQQRRIALLAGFLSRFTIEKGIESVTQGYLRALGESDPGRQEQIWQLLRDSEQALCRQVSQLATDFAAGEPAITGVSKLPIWLPFAPALAGSFDMREALRIHARGICRAVDVPPQPSPRDRAFAISAELLLMQHTCHWFCRSKLVASGRMLSRHRTSYEQLVASVLPQTRAEYLGLVA